MSELDSLYVRVRLSPHAYQQFLASQVVAANHFKDWDVWLDETQWAGLYNAENLIAEAAENAVGESVEHAIHKWSTAEGTLGKSDYDAETEIWQFGLLMYAEDVVSYLTVSAFIRAVCAYKDRVGTDFVLTYPFFWHESHNDGFLIEIDQGKSRTIKRNQVPAICFQEAEEYLGKLIPEEEAD